jgi:hypothetical protein
LEQPKPIAHNRPDGNGLGSRRRPRTLSAPIEVSKFWTNRKGEAVCVTLSTFEGRNICDLRGYFTDAEGKLRPTKKGLAIVVLRLPELAAAVTKALKLAREHGLLTDEEAGA